VQQAVTRDPKFARAWASSAGTRLQFVAAGYGLANALADAEREARLAIALDPRIAQSYVVLAWIAFYRGDWPAAEQGYRQAIAADEQDPVSHEVYGLSLLLNLGHVHAAIEELHRANALAPGERSSGAYLALAYSIAGRDAEALAFRDVALKLGYPQELDPVPAIDITAARRTGRFADLAKLTAEHRSAAERRPESSKDIELMLRGMQDATLRASAVQAIRRLLNSAPQRYLPRRPPIPTCRLSSVSRLRARAQMYLRRTAQSRRRRVGRSKAMSCTLRERT